ncbi:hypothetical protein JCM10213v2_001312 [Rhodosporidiobolus nylandii]
MTPAEFQAAQLESDSEDEERSSADEGPPHKRQKRQTYTAKDFQTPFALPSEVDAWFRRFPCLAKRNFYVVQNHYATSDHFDLRLHLDGSTFSFAIPAGLFDPVSKPKRKAFETDRHVLEYTLLEGATAGGRFTTGVWDIGEYKVLETKVKQKERKKGQEAGLDDKDATDEEETPLSEDERQEALFRDGIHNINYLPTPAVKGRPGLPARGGSGKGRGLVIELNGERFRQLVLTFSRSSDSAKCPCDRDTGKPKLVRYLMVQLSTPEPAPGKPKCSLSSTEATVIPRDRSLLTNRTMNEIYTDSMAWLLNLSGLEREGALLSSSAPPVPASLSEEDDDDEDRQESSDDDEQLHPPAAPQGKPLSWKQRAHALAKRIKQVLEKKKIVVEEGDWDVGVKLHEAGFPDARRDSVGVLHVGRA